MKKCTIKIKFLKELVEEQKQNIIIVKETLEMKQLKQYTKLLTFKHMLELHRKIVHSCEYT